MKKILIIEDDKILRENTKELLEFSKFKVLTAANGKEGVKTALEVVPDLILCDILMPVMNGYQVLKKLAKSKETANIPFIFLSAKSNKEDIRKGMNLGADDYITKPFYEEELIEAIKSRLAKFEILKKTPFRNSSSSPYSQISTLLELKAFIKAKGERVDFKKKKEIYTEFENANYIYCVQTGIVKSIKLDEDGKELITNFYKEGDLFGFYSFTRSSLYTETTIAVENGFGYKFSTSILQDIINQNIEITLELAEVLTNNLLELKEHLLEMAYGSVLKKTSNTILEFAERIQEDPSGYIKISRSDLASVAGISTESFIRSLSILKKENLIDIEGRNIKILDLKKLYQVK